MIGRSTAAGQDDPVAGPLITAQIGKPVTVRLHSGRVLHGVLDAATGGRLVLRLSASTTTIAQAEVASFHTRERRP